MYIYQDAGEGIKVWISCDGISSPVLGQLFWQSKFILARRNVDLHYTIMMLLAQEDQTCLSKLPSCLISIWCQYQILKVLEVQQSQPQFPHRCVILKGLFISRVTWSFSICWESQRMDSSLRAELPSIHLQDSSAQLPCPTFLSS